MWKYVAAHYKDKDYIAAYEIMSEPRDQTLSSKQVAAVYRAGCETVQAVDPATPCMIGSRSYYKLYAFDDDTFLEGMSNIIYTFDYFNPDKYVFNDGISTYPGSYKCGDLYKGWVPQCCPNGNRNLMVDFNEKWHVDNFMKFIVSFRDKHNVPVFMN
jgi:hypothetical protein